MDFDLTRVDQESELSDQVTVQHKASYNTMPMYSDFFNPGLFNFLNHVYFLFPKVPHDGGLISPVATLVGDEKNRVFPTIRI